MMMMMNSTAVRQWKHVWIDVFVLKVSNGVMYKAVATCDKDMLTPSGGALSNNSSSSCRLNNAVRMSPIANQKLSEQNAWTCDFDGKLHRQLPYSEVVLKVGLFATVLLFLYFYILFKLYEIISQSASWLHICWLKILNIWLHECTDWFDEKILSSCVLFNML